ncbi:hypothetical protein C8K66_1303 [Pseudomonas sp. GV105]|nr:hypothetical protein C8K66_1303 [Pseudomonas sp. GV105]
MSEVKGAESVYVSDFFPRKDVYPVNRRGF